MNNIAKSCTKFFSTSKAPTKLILVSGHRFSYAQTIIRTFYVILAFFCLRSLDSWPGYLSKTNLEPLWPVSWLSHVRIDMGIAALLWFYLIGGILALTAIRWRVARVIIFLALLEFLAFTNSFGKINHGSHLQLFISFIFIFLPAQWHTEKPRKDIRAATLILFSGCQAAIMLTYTMSGFFKVIYIPVQMMRHQVHSLMPDALPLQIAARLLETDEMSLLGTWFIDHHLLAWPLMLGTIYLQFFSLWAACRPSLHQLWGIGLISFHLASYLTMTISFWQNCLWLALFLLNSPFRPKRFDVKQILRDLPSIPWLNRGFKELA